MSASPNGLAAKPYLISTPAPPLFISPGSAASSETQTSCKRPRTGQARIQRSVEHTLGLAQKRFYMFERETLQKSFGVTPAHAEKSR
jgi:hypothetical protein